MTSQKIRFCIPERNRFFEAYFLTKILPGVRGLKPYVFARPGITERNRPFLGHFSKKCPKNAKNWGFRDFGVLSYAGECVTRCLH